MSKAKAVFAAALALLALSLGLFLGSRGLAQQEVAPPGAAAALPLRATSFVLTLGLKDAAPTPWDGKITLSEGRVVAIEILSAAQGAKVAGNSWTARSAAAGGRGKKARATPVRLRITLDAPRGAKAQISTAQGQFSFVPGQLALGQPLALLEGRARVVREIASTAIVATPDEEDFPAAAVGPDGTAWAVYTAYQHGTPTQFSPDMTDFSSLVTKNNGDQLRLVSFRDGAWSAPINITEPQRDIWRPTVAVDGDGLVWVIWSESPTRYSYQRNPKQLDNWDLYARTYDPRTGKLSEIRRLTTNPGADICPVAATNPRTGAVVWAWMSWNAGSFDIKLAASRGPLAQTPRVVAQSPANEWNPAIAIDSKGIVYVGYDTYEKGDYDVIVVRRADGENSERIPVATSPLFEARVSLACDSRDRLWVAYEQGDANWGKDFGVKWPGAQGAGFYIHRTVVVRCIDGPRILAPAGDLEAALGEQFRIRKSIPRIAVDGSGRVWLLFRKHGTAERPVVPGRTLTVHGEEIPMGGGTIWSSWAAVYEGNSWSGAIALPSSSFLIDNRPALAPLKTGELVVVYSTDSRGEGRRGTTSADLRAALLPARPGAAEPALVPAQPPTVADYQPIHPNEAAEIARMAQYRVSAGGKQYLLLRGEFHRHTEISSHRDADGPLEELWRYGLDVAKMDWIGNGDHNNGYHQEYPWWLIQKQTDIFHNPPTFVPMFSYERSQRFPNGHRNPIFAQRGIRTLPNGDLQGTPEKGCPDTKMLYRYLKFFGGICASHTSATNMGTDWRDNDPEVEPVVEIYQGRRQSYEHPGAPLTAKSPEDSEGGYRPEGYVWNALEKGYRLGFESSSDHWSTHISYAVVLAEGRTRQAVLDALKKRHCYAANDNVILDVRCGDHIMGDEFVSAVPPKLEIKIIGTAPVARVDVIKDNRYVYTVEPKKAEVSFTWADNAAQAGKTSYYYVRFIQENHITAWGSPMWVTYKP